MNEIETEAFDGSSDEKPFKELEPLKDTPVAPAHVVASIALNIWR